MPRLRLEPVTRANVRAACQLTVRPDQEGLVAPVAWSIASAYTVPDIAWPRLIYDGDQLVGFIMAAFDPQNPDPLYRAYLWRLNIGADHQGRGYGQFAVDTLCQEALRRGQDKLTVSYHPGENGPEGFTGAWFPGHRRIHRGRSRCRAPFDRLTGEPAAARSTLSG